MICDKLAADAITAFHGHRAEGIDETRARALAACWAARKHGRTLADARDAIDKARGIEHKRPAGLGILHAI